MDENEIKLTDYQRKYLLRLSQSAIPHDEFIRWGKRPVAVIMSLMGAGLAECIHPDDEDAYCPTSDSAEGTWQITDAGLARLTTPPA